MKWLNNIPLRRKVTVVILMTCSAVLLLACGVLAVYQMVDYRKMMARDMAVLAEVVAENTRAAMAFDDQNKAEDTLNALKSEPSVVAACIYDQQGSPFATYTLSQKKIQFPVHPGKDGVKFEFGGLRVFHPIMLNNKRLGTLFIQADLSGLHDRLLLFGGIAALVLIGSCLVALLLSTFLQKPITAPILKLADTVQFIAEQNDYSIRAPSSGQNEVSRLATAFNHLLAGIEERDKTLRSSNATLQGEITERKAANDRVQSQLARLEMLNRITRAIGERQDLQSIFQVVIRTLEEHLPLDFCCVALYRPEQNAILVSGVGVRSEAIAMELALTERSLVPIDQNGLSQCVHGRLVYEADITTSEFPFPKRLARGGLAAMVAAPLLVESQVFGVLIAARRERESFSSGECEFLRQLSEHVALAAHQAQIYTALQQAYDDLRQTQQAVMQQERLRALGQMASGIAHDINNAISPVALYTESLLENEPSLSPRARNYLETIQHAIEDVTHTVARMREFYRQRDTQFTLAPIQLNPLVKQAVDISRARWSDMPQQRGVSIEMKTEFAESLPIVMGLESEIREALVNLIFNAVDAMSNGGILTLRTKPLPPAADANGNRGSVALEVSDTGVGMDEDTRRRCLEPFFTTKGERGTGLGLAMVYGIVQRHNASIEIDSVLGKGTTMRMIFPIPQNWNGGSQERPTAFAIPSRRRILIVDDDPLLIKSLRDALETDGHLVTPANGGQAGIETFQKAKAEGELFDVVITDLGMPNVDGRRVAVAIKEASASTPVIMLTGWGQRLTAEGDIPPCVDRVLSKPPKLRDLREALAQCVQQNKQ
ncbi:MAG TPA: CHASE sensor domain-containing protein [Verrucomicrobiae bacterium]|jgi:signal transduction histidine kinase/ActR/RegA family two-component response regulator/HAMP domain-containing protein|nr:CHASE sensor domain-containing protein [Verrucomicrobiae bacterium]